jgi:hypothetical protein
MPRIATVDINKVSRKFMLKMHSATKILTIEENVKDIEDFEGRFNRFIKNFAFGYMSEYHWNVPVENQIKN